LSWLREARDLLHQQKQQQQQQQQQQQPSFTWSASEGEQLVNNIATAATTSKFTFVFVALLTPATTS